MIASNEISEALAERLRPDVRRQRPSFRWSDLWKAPLHDFPIRDEVLYQYLPLAPDMDVLEIGPGSGYSAFRLARYVRHLTVVDAARGNIERLRAAMKDLPNLDFVCADACSPDLAEFLGTRFDAIFGMEVLQHLPDPGTCLKSLAALLRPRGHLLIQFPNYPPPKSPGVTFFPARADLDRLMHAAGFARWEVYALQLRPYADFVFRFHERPMRLYRRLRHADRNGRPQTYDGTWAFQQRKGLETYKVPLHGAWAALFAALRLGGDCFERTLLGDQILNKNLLLMARRQGR